ncbi:hypothetical protein WNY78_13990 [Psychroserpens sp. AS72]|uniref:hypothetical protein n=1 Tax=Psychroserpens sp. AS72 TaxID=3135775 RepID=UPI0031779525
MQQHKQHITYSIATLILIVALALPTVVKFTHAFSHHNHDVCTDYSQTHLHNLDADCSFYNFKITNHYTFSIENYELYIPIKIKQITASQYQFLSDYQRLQFSLRGPPIYS